MKTKGHRIGGIIAQALTLALFLLPSLGCSGEPGCRDDLDCADGRRCHPDLERCAKPCTQTSLCPAGERCDPGTSFCRAVRCPRKATPVGRTCRCRSRDDCPDLAFCDLPKQGEGRCAWLCLPGGKGPTEELCVCPTGWEWAGSRCRPRCPPGMNRGADEVCEPRLAAGAPVVFERGADRHLRWRCRSPFGRRSDGTCRQNLPAGAAQLFERDPAGGFRWRCPKGWFRDGGGVCRLGLPGLPDPARLPTGPDKPGSPDLRVGR